jgi:hypothetical protein
MARAEDENLVLVNDEDLVARQHLVQKRSREMRALPSQGGRA